MRVVIDNDFSGDPDDLFQTAHHLLSPSVEPRFIIGSHLRPDDPFDPSGNSAANAVKRVDELLGVMGLRGKIPVYQGASTALMKPKTPMPSDAVNALIAEAMRDDTDIPLFVACGGGLTDLASALIIEPRIADRMTVIWIGGPEYSGINYQPPNMENPEYNLNIDIRAAQVVFEQQNLRLWQVPRDAYRQCILSFAELELDVLPCGKLGRFLYDAIASLSGHILEMGGNIGETYIMGDSPLVLLTALQSSFQNDPSSCAYVLRERPSIETDGSYGPGQGGNLVRVYTRIDTRLMFADFFRKLKGAALSE